MQHSHLMVLRRPIVTEKNMERSEKRPCYTFEIAAGANKIEVRKAVEKVFNATVDPIKTITVKGKRKRRGSALYRTGALKKAIVTLKEGQKIDLV